MQFFSSKKALLTVSLAALGGLAACGDDVTVPVPPLASVVISITPPNATMNIGDTQIFSVQITGGSTTTPPTLTSCSSSNNSVVTVVKATSGSSCNVTAVAAGNATITAVASTSQQASSAVTVSALAPAIGALTLSPPSANLSPSQTVVFTPNVVRGAPGNAVAYTYTTSNALIATISAPAANGAVTVTAVAPGVATITATAVGTGAGFSSATSTASATVTVGTAPQGINSLSVQPSSLQMAIGRTAGLTATLQQPAGAPAATITYVSSNPAVATVGLTSGVVTAISAGSANITVTASAPASANGAFGAVTLTQIVAVTVAPLANVSIQAIRQGPYITTGIDSAYTVSAGCQLATTSTGINPCTGFAGSGPVGPTLGVIAGIRRALNPQVNQPVDVTNTKDQIQVTLNLQSNGQRVDSVVVFIDSTNALSSRRAAARQLFTNGDAGQAQTVSVELFILTEDFSLNTTTGDGETFYKNGLKGISAAIFTTLTQGQTCVPGGTPAPNNTTPCEVQAAANVRQNLNFNNIDGFAITPRVLPAGATPLTPTSIRDGVNRANDAQNRTWWGGPTSTDSTFTNITGAGNFRAYPVIYTPNRSIRSVSATFGRCRGFGVDGLPGFVTSTRADPTLVTRTPFDFTWGKSAPAAVPATNVHIACTGIVGAYDVGDNFRFEDYPMIVASLDDQNNPGPRVLYAYNPTQGPDPYGGPRPTLYRGSPQVPFQEPMRIDYENPVLTLAVTQSNLERFVNDAYLFNTGLTATDMPTFPPTPVYPGAGVGLLATRNSTFFVASANPACGPQTFQPVPGTRTTANIGGIFTIAPSTNRESPCDFTNNAFLARAEETDRLGNRGTIGVLGAPGTAGVIAFGIDNTAPELQISFDGAGPIPDTPNHYRATGDSIFQPVNNATGVAATPFAIGAALNPTDFFFGARYRDERSGFNITNSGTRRVVRFRPNATPLLSNRAVIDTVSTRTLGFIGGNGNPVENEDPTYRRDSVTIYGAGALGGATGNGTGANAVLTANPPVGYYLYTLTVTDRAGNSNSLTERAVIDQTSPIVTGTTIPPVLGGTGFGAAVVQQFNPTGTDDVEAIDFDMFLRYQALAMVGDSSNGSTVINSGARLRFRRDKFANPHNAWQVFSDTLLNTPFGPTGSLSANQITSPIATIRGIEPVDSTDAPISYAATSTNGGAVTVVNPFTGFKPNFLGAYAFDVRATHVNLGAPNGWPAPYAASLPFKDLGMTNMASSVGVFGEAGYVESIFAGIVSLGARWDLKDLNPNTPGTDRLVGWSGFGGTGASIEFRAITSTVVTQPPFPQVHLLKWEANAQHTGSGVGTATTTINDSAAGQWVFIGTITSSAPSNPVINDQGSTRFWRYIFTAAAFPTVTNGMIVQAGVTTGCYRAVGVDAPGDGITTRSFGTGCPATVGVFANQITVVSGPTNATITLRAYGNGTGTIAATTGVLPFTLQKSSQNGVERVSQNRPNTGETFTITPTGGSTIDRTPTGCQPTTPVVFPTALPFNCTYTLNTPTTVTVIFELPGAGAP